MGMKVLVTGANGFIGQHLVRNLINDGNSVRALKHSNLKLNFIKESEVEWLNADLRNPNSLKNICNNIDIVYHLGAISRNEVDKTWEDYEAVNINGTKQLLEQAALANVKRFVFVSTVEAAGFGNGIDPRKETDQPNPQNNYGKSKLEAEQIVLNSPLKIERVVLRLPMTYGPGTFLIIPKLFGMVKKGIYPIIGSGQNKMEFAYVGNIVKAILLVGEHKNANNELFYVSDERSYSIIEVIKSIANSMNCKVIFIKIPKSIAYVIAIIWELVAKILPFPPIISKVSKKPFFSKETVWWTTRNVNTVSISKIQNLLGYEPPYTIKQGCQETSKWLIENWPEKN